ncbi:MAG: hypothetical protein Ct9H300mP1_21770 [Planctomycetaceae bacterium]|nr:MAG: hypothetical protein Ct9H300mP1_21770 [Planctomycetaceae bacterium]
MGCGPLTGNWPHGLDGWLGRPLLRPVVCHFCPCRIPLGFQPIRALHEGARRVAQGDLDYRVELSTRDEMAELAESFNQMTDRFRIFETTGRTGS